MAGFFKSIFKGKHAQNNKKAVANKVSLNSLEKKKISSGNLVNKNGSKLLTSVSRNSTYVNERTENEDLSKLKEYSILTNLLNDKNIKSGDSVNNHQIDQGEKLSLPSQTGHSGESDAKENCRNVDLTDDTSHFKSVLDGSDEPIASVMRSNSFDLYAHEYLKYKNKSYKSDSVSNIGTGSNNNNNVSNNSLLLKTKDADGFIDDLPDIPTSDSCRFYNDYNNLSSIIEKQIDALTTVLKFSEGNCTLLYQILEQANTLHKNYISDSNKALLTFNNETSSQLTEIINIKNHLKETIDYIMKSISNEKL